MAKKGRHRKGGRTTPKGTRPQGFRPRYEQDDVDGEPPEPDLMDSVRLALAREHPFDFLSVASMLLNVVDPRSADPLAGDRLQLKEQRDEVLGVLGEGDRVETTALLTAFAAMTADDVERRRLEQVVKRRSHPLPTWLTTLADAEAYRCFEMVHILGDGDNVFVGVRLTTGDELTAVVYIDHNLGTVAKDAFVIPDSIDATLATYQKVSDDPDTTFAELDPADAKARIVAAIESGARTYPPYESESWPACRPLVDWMTRLLPDGGHPYERPEWSEDDQAALTEQFFASPFGVPLDDEDHRDLFGSILWFACGYGPGDPLRWSPVAVELLLADWIPRKIVADADHLAKAPNVLRAFIRYSHYERDIAEYLTTETLAAVDTWEPEYQQTIHTHRPQGPYALLAKMGAIDPDRSWDLPFDEDRDKRRWDHEGLLLERLEAAVGGSKALAELDDAPLPDEAFDWTGVDDDIRDRVAEVLALVDRCCDEMFDVEHRTACRRMLARIATNGPEVFRRRGRSESAAAAICWAVSRANVIGRRDFGPTLEAYGEQFGIKPNGITDRAATLLIAAGFATSTHDILLGSPDYLVAKRRREILDAKASFTPDGTGPIAPPTSGTATVHQLRITITGIDPPVWRRLQVPSTTTLAGLHRAIQTAFGWTDSHLHQFAIGDRLFGPPSQDDWDEPTLNEGVANLDQIAPPHTSFTYTYDLGDDWNHHIVVEDVLPADAETTHPRCIDGARSGPPEDVGGVWGYDALLETLADPEPDPDELDDVIDLVGDHFDPDAFDLNEINARLSSSRR